MKRTRAEADQSAAFLLSGEPDSDWKLAKYIKKSWKARKNYRNRFNRAMRRQGLFVPLHY